jgi:hypothetical protein
LTRVGTCGVPEVRPTSEPLGEDTINFDAYIDNVRHGTPTVLKSLKPTSDQEAIGGPKSPRQRSAIDACHVEQRPPVGIRTACATDWQTIGAILRI